jgi:hypothetical protein
MVCVQRKGDVDVFTYLNIVDSVQSTSEFRPTGSPVHVHASRSTLGSVYINPSASFFPNTSSKSFYQKGVSTF